MGAEETEAKQMCFLLSDKQACNGRHLVRGWAADVHSCRSKWREEQGTSVLGKAERR